MDGTPRCPARLDVAAALAAEHGARLTAVFAAAVGASDAAFTYAAAANAGAALQAGYAERLGRALAAFDSARAARPEAAIAWCETHGAPVASALAQQARFADLVVLGAPDGATAHEPAGPPDLAAAVMADSGRPALVLPAAGPLRPVGRRIFVAWKDAPESARALAAALPLLERAEHVHVASWGVRAGDTPRWAGAPLRLEHHLGAHGVPAEMHRFAGEPRDLGRSLLDMAHGLDADLVVMGCYGHSRAREWVFGGVTRTALREARLPLLMSH